MQSKFGITDSAIVNILEKVKLNEVLIHIKMRLVPVKISVYSNGEAGTLLSPSSTVCSTVQKAILVMSRLLAVPLVDAPPPSPKNE